MAQVASASAHGARTIRNTATKHLVGAAEKGDAIAQFNLGVFLDNRVDDNGHAAIGDRTAAIEWLSRAAGQDLACAQIKLGEIYAESADSPKHCIASCAWFLRAIPRAKGAHRQKALSGFERVSAQMAPEQVATARHLASSDADGTAEESSVTLEAYLE
ncbi:MAG: hypothetical protein WAN51_11690 [Alphaproteobacteria bacterium]